MLTYFSDGSPIFLKAHLAHFKHGDGVVLQAGRQVAHHQIRRQRRIEQKADLLRRPRCRFLLGVLTAAAGATVYLRRIVGAAAARLLPALRVRLQRLIELSDQRVFVVGVRVDAKDGAAADAGGALIH
jgi:hypothetical protein